ncbi:hypothetical protein DPMN_042767 [Dreissena polymorpha]|uniref:Uncharacterized protein n=1 Tax=Dreissena polymorpha TaxID=45954 RepID=A0A9D4D1M0_DREPO|nr:hypothetical protein DPMN_042767 [Dreissena polymorpha]
MTSEYPGSHVKCPAPGGHVFQATGTIFELVPDTCFIGTNLLTKFHDDQTMNVASRVLTRKNAPPPWRPCFPPIGTIFELIQDIIGTNSLTKLHDDPTINVASRVLISHIKKNAPPPPWTFGGHVFKATETIFELIQDIIGTKLLTKFHEDLKINVASREKCPAPGGHVFQLTGIIFELVQDIIGINLLTKFHEDGTINVASRVVLTRQILTLQDGLQTKGDHKSSP